MKLGRLTHHLFVGAVVVDLVALLIPAAHLDFYLRPLALLVLFAHAVSAGAGSGGRPLRWWLVPAGLFAAALVEGVQRLNLPGQWPLVAGGTAAYYALYTLGFGLAPAARFSVRAHVPIAGVSVYMVAMFFWLQPYGLIREPAFLYIPVTALLIGLALNPLAHGARDAVAYFRAAGGLLLLASDSVRVIALLKLQSLQGTWAYESLIEAVIMALFFAGQYGIVRSLPGIATPASPSDQDQAMTRSD